MLRLYKAFIRPHLEYSPQVWDPYFAKDVELLQRCQKFALRVCTKEWSSAYPDLLNSTHLPTLSERRKVAKLCHLYKIFRGLTDCQSAPVFQKPITYSGRRNPIQLKQLNTHSTQFHFSFYPHAISIWNNLCINNDSLLTLNTFKRCIT